ncbi:MAG: ABC transporter permease [bacterium]
MQHIWFQRHLVWEFLRRDLQARYAGSAMGFFWSVINPLILLLMYTFVFGIILRVPGVRFGVETDVGDFAFYVFCGLLPWYAFQESLVRSTTCIVDNAHLIKQVRFPAKVLPVYITLSSLVNQLIGTVIFLLFLIFPGKAFWTLMAFPLVLTLEFFLFIGVGLFFAACNTYLRDIAPLVTIAAMVLMWSTPMFYTLDLLKNAPEWVWWIIHLNPLSYLVMIHHHLFLYGTMPPVYYWVVLGGISGGAFVLGYWFFTRSHGEFADLL